MFHVLYGSTSYDFNKLMLCFFVDCDSEQAFLEHLSDEFLTSSGSAAPGGINHGPDRCRLLEVNTAEGIGGWTAAGEEPFWIQADLRQLVFVDKVATQGRGDGTFNQWVTSYALSVGFNVESLNRLEPVFAANTDQTTVALNRLEPVLTRFVRLWPLEWNNHPTLRWEVFGCSYGAPSCPTLPSAHASLTTADVTVASHVLLTCDVGFRLTSGQDWDEVTCEGSGLWSKDFDQLHCQGTLA